MSKHEAAANMEAAIRNAAPPYSKRIWLDECPPSVQSDIKEVRRRFHAGKYVGACRTQVAKAILAETSKHLGRPPSIDAVVRWLAKTDQR